MLEGTFNIRGGEFELLDGPVWSHELLEELQLAFNAIVADPPADPIAPVERLSPSLGRDLRRVTRGWTTERILHLMASIGGILAFAGVDAHDVMQWVAWYLETVERHPHM